MLRMQSTIEMAIILMGIDCELVAINNLILFHGFSCFVLSYLLLYSSFCFSMWNLHMGD